VELPRLEPLYQELKSEGFQIIAIELTNNIEKATNFIAEHGLTYPLLDNPKDEEEIIMAKLGVHVFPTSYLVNQEGKVIYMHIGFVEGDEVKLEEEIRSLMK
jgi:peroxiredoxin